MSVKNFGLTKFIRNDTQQRLFNKYSATSKVKHSYEIYNLNE